MFVNIETMEKKMIMRVSFAVDDIDVLLPVSYGMEKAQPKQTAWQCRVEDTKEALPEWVTREFVVTKRQSNGVSCRTVVPVGARWSSLYGAMFADQVAGELVFKERQRVLLNQS